MGFEDVIGHARAVATLTAAVRGGRVHHAWLFSGPEGVGKERVALRFAQALSCEADPALRPCGGCAACRRIEAGTHPDVLFLMPEAERVERRLLSKAELDRAPSRDLRIADVREMERRVRLPAYEGGTKVVVITPAERMNVAAQNALLKTLEEPPSGTVLVLVTAAEGLLLPTVRSRCLRVPFAPLPVEVVAERVGAELGVDPGDARILATLAGGSLGRALALDPETIAARRDLVARLRALSPGDGAGLTAFAEGFASDRDEAERNLDLVALWYRDVLALQAGADAGLVANADLVDEAAADASRLAPRELLRRLEGVEEARRAIAFNVTPRLAVEALVAAFRAPAGRPA